MPSRLSHLLAILGSFLQILQSRSTVSPSEKATFKFCYCLDHRAIFDQLQNFDSIASPLKSVKAVI